ncbi:aminoglycoside 6-adenylyltransferase [Mesorhizobium sp. M0772]|uniref:aminoglycoside 6-adenylyltransferase n=1 Tax=Mesorhizobium sp. M0772 TaxID=2956998 RepID=UPI0033370D95
MSEAVRILSRLTTLAEAHPAIRGMLLIGSHARRDTPADRSSDIDIVVITTDPPTYLADDWLNDLAPAILSIVEKAAVGEAKERRLLLGSGQDLDIVPISLEQFQSALVSGKIGEVHDILARGMRWLVDKDGLASRLPKMNESRPSIPTAGDLDDVVQDFWFHAVWTAKKLRRGEIWVAMGCCDGYLKKLLLRAIEWHARTLYGLDHDTWFRGRFVERWASPAVVDRLATVYATYDQASLESALLRTTELFDDLAEDIAQNLSLPLPVNKSRQAKAIMMKILAGERLDAPGDAHLSAP